MLSETRKSPWRQSSWRQRLRAPGCRDTRNGGRLPPPTYWCVQGATSRCLIDSMAARKIKHNPKTKPIVGKSNTNNTSGNLRESARIEQRQAGGFCFGGTGPTGVPLVARARARPRSASGRRDAIAESARDGRRAGQPLSGHDDPADLHGIRGGRPTAPPTLGWGGGPSVSAPGPQALSQPRVHFPFHFACRAPRRRKTATEVCAVLLATLQAGSRVASRPPPHRFIFSDKTPSRFT